MPDNIYYWTAMYEEYLRALKDACYTHGYDHDPQVIIIDVEMVVGIAIRDVVVDGVVIRLLLLL